MIGTRRTTQRMVRFLFGMLAVGLIAQQSVAAGPPAPPGGGARPPTDGVETLTKTMILRASSGQLTTAWATSTAHKSVYYVPVPVACPRSVFGTGSPPVAAGEILVGYDNAYDPGSGPFPCWDKSDEIFRAAVYFPLDAYAKIPSKWLVSARLSYRLRGSDVRGEEPGTYGGDYPLSCAAHLDLATASPFTGAWADMTATEPYTNLPPAREGGSGLFAIDVTAAVNRMAVYPDAYHGFVFSGADESFGENNNGCLSRYSDFQLTLNYVLGK